MLFAFRYDHAQLLGSLFARFEHYVTVFAQGKDFYYAGSDGPKVYTSDAIASRGIVRCAMTIDKVARPDGKPFRASEKPVPLLQYIITTLVRLRSIHCFRGCI